MRELCLPGKASRSEAAIAALAARQHGVLTRAQAFAAGLSDKAIWGRNRSGAWVRVHAGVYRVAAVPESWRGRLMAACLALGPEAVVSHRAAAALWRLDVDDGALDVTVTGTGERRLAGVTVHRTRELLRVDRGEVDGLPVTRPARTVIDLAALGDVNVLEAAFDCGLRERRFSLSYFERRLRAVGPRGRNGVAHLRRLVDDRRRNPPADSGRERRLSRELVAAGLPQPRRQFDIDGMHFDLAYPDAKIAIEFDSYRHHHGRAAWRKDQARHNRATARGWLVFHQTATDGVQAIVEAYRHSMSA